MDSNSNGSSQAYDFLIIGGGISGVSLAREAALRGYSVAVLEKNDFSSGTSSRSGKLIHGGVRYLETLDLKVVRESCRERETQLYIAPHLAKTQPILFISNSQGKYRPWQLKIALTFYDFVSGNPQNRKSRIFSKKKLKDKEPLLNSNGLKGAGLFHDLATNDARLTIDTLKSAVSHGAVAMNYTQVTDLLYNNGKVCGVKATNQILNQNFEISASYVINACGPGVDSIRLIDDPNAKPLMKPSKGVHLAFSSERLNVNHGVFMHVASDNGRMNWVLPRDEDGYVFAGATDSYYDGDIDNPSITDADILHVLNATNEMFPDAKLTKQDIISAWSGLRPLIRSDSISDASKVSRRHLITQSSSGLYTLAGGKLSTCRLMAEETIDFVEATEKLDKTKSLSHITPISGGEYFSKHNPIHNSVLSEHDIERIQRNFGSNASKVLMLTSSLDDKLEAFGPGFPLTPAEIRYITRHEHVVHLTDVLIRRTNIFFQLKDAGLSQLNVIGKLVAHELNWSRDRLNSEIIKYQEEVANNRVFSSSELQCQ
ncbi:glycerol-3-phosphate dehydrogenase [Vibrio nigripulchritudo ATCC 27043]|uniref:glycerol-3-phosphate dehydrogenase/oxidase n=1 Tax=Vibrio nigripulchritudo TaxID=28173 RepID=UPI00021C18F8|nr:glycerol-3-phosphate dehydrogenase/oxidase [Vibrio nigripulchritudo]EGU54338.1 glycerol-3-phosphate dehydrogenase [Vibrio nigripulchritudo ATCC 27043]